jgi:Zn finger protein HypA/HybF involved in hydrogenase expression
MHELSLVADLVAQCEQRAGGRPVEVIRVRHASSVPEEALQQAFGMLSVGSCLAVARLELEQFDIQLDCSCGFAGVVGHDDLISGSIAVCPDCGDVSTLHRTAELELLELRTIPT